MANKKVIKPIKQSLTPEQIHAKIIERQADKLAKELKDAIEQTRRDNQ